ncbi:MAG TPA: MFS transporter [Candidatus Paceibacterota bacterium]|nr:MFS transporter [Candidatus Paceibacterota bacterium]
MTREARILLIGSGIWYVGEGLFGPLLAVFSEEIGGTILDLSWAWAAYLIVYGVLSIVFGRLSDTSIDKGKLMVFGYALNAVFTFAYLLVTTPTGLFIVQAGLGVAAAMATPTWDALFDESSEASLDGTSWGLADGTANIITGITIVIGGLIVSYLSFQALFVLMGTIQVIATIYQARILTVRRRQT